MRVLTDLASMVRSSIYSTSGASGTRAHAHGVYCLLSSLNGNAAPHTKAVYVSESMKCCLNDPCNCWWLHRLHGVSHSVQLKGIR